MSETMDVRMPDGTLLQGIPVGTPKAEIVRRYQALQGTTQQPEQGIAERFMRGVQKPVDNLALAASNIPGIGPAVDRLGQALGAPSTAEAVAANEARRSAQPQGIAGLAGNIVGTAPTLALPGGAAVQGASAGAMLTDAKDAGGVAMDAGLGAVGGVVGDRIVRGAQAVIAPQVRPAVQRLQQAGVNMTPGRALGGMASRVEDRLGSVPLLGDMVRNRAMETRVQFNRAVANRVLKPIGANVPDNIEPGRAMVDYAGRKLSDEYQRLVPQLHATIDRGFVQRVDALRRRANLTSDGEALFNRELERIVMDAFDPRTGRAAGKKFQHATSRINDLAATYMRSADPTQREVGLLLGDVRQQLFQLAGRSNPKASEALRRVNDGWANFKVLQIASARTTSPDGIFTPAQFQAAVKAADRSKNKARFASNRARFQKLASDAVDVLPDRIPDSGTAERLGQMGAIGGTVGVATGTVNPLMLAVPAAGMLPYTRTGTRLVERAATSRPAGAARVANALVPLRPGAVVAGPALLLRPDE